MGAFAALGLVLAAIGIFSVTFYSASLRMKEIGIRMALGADRTAVLSIVLKRGLGQLAAGGLMGLGCERGSHPIYKRPALSRSCKRPMGVLCGCRDPVIDWFCGFVLLALRAAWVDSIDVLRCE